MQLRIFLQAGSAAALAISIAACSAGATPVPTAATRIAPAATTGASAAGSTLPTVRVSANSASESEIAAALTAAGVPNGARWAKEVVEYRPYPTNDPTLKRLQDNLAKYNPGAATLAAILATLQP